jgi:hypothetical protein
MFNATCQVSVLLISGDDIFEAGGGVLLQYIKYQIGGLADFPLCAFVCAIALISPRLTRHGNF